MEMFTELLKSSMNCLNYHIMAKIGMYFPHNNDQLDLVSKFILKLLALMANELAEKFVVKQYSLYAITISI